MKTLFLKLFATTAALALVLYVGGCSASEEAEQEEGVKQETPAPTQPQTKATMKKDTAEVKVVPPANVEPEKEMKPPPTASATLYAVQIGAFENEVNAGRAEQAIKARYTYPVRKYFDETTKLYKVSVGSFSTKDQALEFRKLLNEKYPGEYQDAWIVEVQQ
ncbi:MAG: SPOR domain-containing protein [Bacteroidota bacterium]